MTTEDEFNEKFYKEREFAKAFAEKIKKLQFKYPHHEYGTLNQLAAMLYPKLYRASAGFFDDDFDLKTYTEDAPVFEGPADELAYKAKIYSLENQVPYETATSTILDQDPALGERYKMS